ncbi:SusC/RagA family TonB-linked outer membrane protein [Pedobacter sp.]|uniref:SusC/RagA family TonB-linked outer membrane protein n=1 Tax=Pedobacter sp. TaxID=1411316 RepID=UPI002CF5B662|nr:SusC/RagA family TonB-linked outer membrane protein [Pedobacter sp.]HWW42270.1 SusC/RagA family TonB-linked outer membrane protein [Pedobacter sp.]
MQVSAATLAQKISLKEKNAPLEQIFDQIRQQTGYDFLYNKNLLKKARPVNIDLKNATMEETLSACFAGQPFTFSLQEKTIVVKDKAPTFLERVVATLNSIDASGRVVDSENRPLPGASVKVKKTGKGVSTDKDGRFFLRGVEEGAVLVVSFIGYLPKEVNASANIGNVVLEQSLSKLDEVQVIAYGTTTQRLSTGNVTTIRADVIEKQPVNNPLLALQGRVPGLFIEQATGFAGTGVKVRIQGQNSMANGNDPLYVIDGIPFSSQLLPGGNSILGQSGGTTGTSYGNPLDYLNPAEIESIDVLKDADATAIYGSRAANGAILITTKKAQAGDIKVDANLQSGWGKVTRRLDLMNSQQYLEMRREALKNAGIDLTLPPYNTDSYKVFNSADLSFWDTSRYTDWQKELIGGTAQYHDIQTSISGGNSITQFLVGAGYHQEGNVFPGNFDDKKSSVHFRINSTSSNQKFKIQLSGSYLFDDNQLPGDDLTQMAMQLAPIAPALYTSDGKINWEPTPSGMTTFIFNPLAKIVNRFKNKTTNLRGDAILSYRILPGLDIKSSFGYTSLQSDIIFGQLPESLAPEFRTYFVRNTNFNTSKNNAWSIEPQLNYNNSIGKGKLEVLLGATLQKNSSDASSINASGFNTEQVIEDVGSATSLIVNWAINSVYKYNALFGRINYNWADRYILNLTARRDGSSRFGPENHFHNFGAVGAAWIFSKEKLLENQLAFLSFGKLRGSYGTTGSDQISDYQYISLYNPYSVDIVYQGAKGYLPDRLTNPYLQWEETKKLQIGIDLGFLKDRILLNTNYSFNRSSNQLLSYPLPLITGFGSIYRNLPATVQNTGWEFTLSTTNVKTSNFSWTSSFNLTLPKNKLVAFTNLENSSYNKQLVVGKSLNIIQLYHFVGVDNATGIYKFTDQSGNATYSPDRNKDNTVIINPDPKFYGGFQNSFAYKAFQLDVLFQFTKQIGMFNSFPQVTAGYYNLGNGNQTTQQLDRWQKSGDNVSRQQFSAAFQSNYIDGSDADFGDASYVRLKNLSVSWQVPLSWQNTIHLRSCKLYVQGQNLLTITNYKGLDPETKSSYSLPPLRVITMGLKIGL